MKVLVIHHYDSPFPLLGVWIIVILIVYVVGALSQNPAVSSNHSYNENNQKVQYITIGGTSQSKTTDNP